jgi:CMP-N,N'-diacetyllegionaminic acid synthase
LKPLCLIGARGGSKGVTRKNLKLLGKKPLIAHTIESAINSKIFSNVVVSTEDEEIASISKKYGAEVPFLRPKKLATDSASMTDVMLHGLNQLRSLGYKFEIFVNRDCTVPFLRSKDIKNSILLLKKRKSDAVFCVYKQHLNPYFNMMEKNSKGYLQFVKNPNNRPNRRQDAPTVYQLNGSFTYNVNSFLKSKNPFPPKSLAFEIPSETGLMIDTEIEFKIAELLLTHKYMKIE